MAISKSADNIFLKLIYKILYLALILRCSDSCRYYNRSVVFGHILISTVNNEFITRMLCYAGLKVVVCKYCSNTAKEIVHLYMALYPDGHLHVWRNISKSKTAERKNCCKQPAVYFFSGIRILPIRAYACPVNFNLLSGFVLDNVLKSSFLQVIVEVFLETSQLVVISRSLISRLFSRRISRYLVI